MLFDDPARRYPHLVQVLNVFGRRRFSPPVQYVGPSIAIAAPLIGLMVYGSSESFFTGFMVMVFMFVVAAVVAKNQRKKPKQPVDHRAIAATEVAKGMGLMLAKRRLHRDLDEGSLMLIEECARQWLRAKAALDAPFWKSPQVPAHYQQVRMQALEAADDSMDDVLLHYRNFVPDEVPNRHALDYVDEALEQFNPRGRKRTSFQTVDIGPVMEIAEKLSQLASEAERMANEMRFDPAVSAEAAPSRSLDETLSELREIRQAEEELRQNLRG